MSKKEYKAGTYALRLAKKHPRKQMAHGKHMVQPVPYLYDLSADEVELLDADGAKAWIKSVDKKGIEYKVKTKKEMSPKDRLISDLKEKKVKLSGKETIAQLEELMKKEISK